MGRKRRSRSRSLSKGRRKDSRDRGSYRSSRSKDTRGSSSRQRRRDSRSRSRSRSSSRDSDDRRRRRRYSSSSPESPQEQRRKGRDTSLSKRTDPSLTTMSKQSAQERSQARIASLLEKTDERYRSLEVEQRLPSAPTSSTLAKIEAEGFTPQAFTSHKSEAKVSSSEGTPARELSHDSHVTAIYGGNVDLTAVPTTTPGPPTHSSKTESHDLLTDNDRLSMWLSRLQTLRSKYKSPNTVVV